MVVIKPVSLDNLAGTIRNRRMALAMTHEELGKLSGLSQSMIARIESGKRVPSLVSLFNILTALEYQIEINLSPIDQLKNPA